MLRSMTGYGASRRQTAVGLVSIEIKTVNNKFLAISGHAPDGYQSCLCEIEKLIRGRVSRGTARYWMKVSANDESAFAINEAVLKRYMEQVDSLCRQLGKETPGDIGSLLPLPGVVCQVENTSERVDAALPVALELTAEALDRLDESRLTEGVRLEEDLAGRARCIHEFVTAVKARLPEAAREFHATLCNRVNALLHEHGVTVEREDVLKELAYYAQREDIMEEMTRLDSHLHQLAETIRLGEPVGRKLEFISQEMLREANTMSSKLHDTSLAQVVVDIKTEVTRIREQISNVE